MDYEHNQVGLYYVQGLEASVSASFPPGPSLSVCVVAGAGSIYGFDKSIREYGGWATSGGIGLGGSFKASAEANVDGWQSGLPWQPSNLSGVSAGGAVGLAFPPGVTANAHGAVTYARPASVLGLPLVSSPGVAESWMRFVTDLCWWLEGGRSVLMTDDARESVRQY
jgi:hypothetical protein